ncbi:hypothetical protein BJD96_08685 [Staphylococcus nepalensis]|nr:hypothetical protein BJD96_08685 [Staphylococcus nepalensis]
MSYITKDKQQKTKMRKTRVVLNGHDMLDLNCTLFRDTFLYQKRWAPLYEVSFLLLSSAFVFLKYST